MNKIGIKWALVLGSMSFPIQGSAYYCNSKFGNEWVSHENQSLSRNGLQGIHLTINISVFDS